MKNENILNSPMSTDNFTSDKEVGVRHNSTWTDIPEYHSSAIRIDYVMQVRDEFDYGLDVPHASPSQRHEEALVNDDPSLAAFQSYPGRIESSYSNDYSRLSYSYMGVSVKVSVEHSSSTIIPQNSLPLSYSYSDEGSTINSGVSQPAPTAAPTTMLTTRPVYSYSYSYSYSASNQYQSYGQSHPFSQGHSRHLSFHTPTKSASYGYSTQFMSDFSFFTYQAGSTTLTYSHSTGVTTKPPSAALTSGPTSSAQYSCFIIYSCFPAVSTALQPTIAPTSYPAATATPTPTYSPSVVPYPSMLVPTGKPSTRSTNKPAVRTTTRPTTQPPGMPSMKPTEHFNINCSANDITQNLRGLHPFITSTSGALLMLPIRFNAKLLLGSTASWNQSFGLLFGSPPGSVGQLTVELGGRFYSSVSYATTAQPVASIYALLKTFHLYVGDPTAQVSYQVRDAVGRAQVSTNALSITLSATNTISKAAHLSACGLPVVSSGLGLCDISIPTSWFSTANDVSVNLVVSVTSGSIVLAQSDVMLLTLHRVAAFSALTSAGMVAVLPQKTYFPGGSFDVVVTANTLEQALSTWQITVSFDSQLVSLTATATASNYVDVVLAESLGQIKMSTSGLAPGVSYASVTGPNVATVSLTFKVNDNANAGLHSSSLSLFVDQMVNAYSIAFATAVVGQVNSIAGSLSTGSLMVSALEAVGILAYSSQNELINTAPLTGSLVSSAIKVVIVYNRAGQSLLDVSSTSVCVSSNTSILDVGNCTVSVSRYHTLGSSSVSVEVKHLTFTVSLPFRVWFPTSVTVTAVDSNLGEILTGSEVRDGCRSYQTTKLLAYGTFGGAGLRTESAYISSLVMFTSSDVSVASVAGVLLRGLSVGHTTVSISAAATVHIIPSVVSVTNAVVHVERLSVIVLSSTSAQAIAAAGIYDSITVIFSAQLHLSAEGNTADVVVYANFDDGTYLDVSDHAAVSSSNRFIGVSRDAQNLPRITVLPGATSLCDRVIVASWGVCGNNVTGKGVVSLQIPKAVAVTITTPNTTLAKASDTAVLAPFFIASYTLINIAVQYEDGTTKSFSSPYDSRAVLKIVSGSGLVRLTDNTLSVLSTAATGVATIEVSFPGLYTLTKSVSVAVVSFSSLSISTAPYPLVTGIPTKSIISRIGCSGVYQRLVLSSQGYLSDGTSADISSYTTYSSSAPSVVDISNANVLYGVALQLAMVSRLLAALQTGVRLL